MEFTLSTVQSCLSMVPINHSKPVKISCSKILTPNGSTGAPTGQNIYLKQQTKAAFVQWGMTLFKTWPTGSDMNLNRAISAVGIVLAFQR